MEDKIAEVDDDYENVGPRIEQEKPEEKKSEKEDNTKYLLLTAAVLLIMILAIIGFKRFINPGSKSQVIYYNEFTFVKEGPLWHTQWKNNQGQVFNVPLHFNPYQAENVSMTGQLSRDFDFGEVYITHDPADYGLEYVSIAAAELSMNMATALGMNPIAACSRNETMACADRPIKDCNSNSVIYLKQEGPTQITLNNTCIIIQGERAELVRAVDKILYMWYGIIKLQ